uniref:Uncharacterized protein n=1 Tax=Anguilla anguilla TaxID=7936 RepID=A0A0E9Q0T7_ANGAN
MCTFCSPMGPCDLQPQHFNLINTSERWRWTGILNPNRPLI